MKFGFVGAFATLLLGAGWAVAQAPAPAPTGGPTTTGPVTVAPVNGPTAPPPANGSTYLPANAMAGPDTGTQFWVQGDYLLWRLRNGHLPPAVAAVPVGLLSVDTSDLFVTSPSDPTFTRGVPVVSFAPVSIQSNATAPGAGNLDPGEHSGGRISLGFWCDPEQTIGVELSSFWLDKRTAGFNATTANTVNQFTIDTGFTQNLFLVSGTPGMETQSLLRTFNLFFVRQADSTLTGSLGTEMWGGEINAVGTCLYFGGMRFGGLVGFRYLNYHEELNINNNVRLFRPDGFPITDAERTGSLPADLSFSTNDTIRATNNFYGAQIGADVEAGYCGFFLNTRFKAGVGVNHQTVSIDSTTTSPSGTFSGGLLASPLDIGKHSRDRIAFVPELNLKLGYAFTGWLRAYVGYDWLYMTNTVRSTNVTDTASINTHIQVAGSTNDIKVAQPTFNFRDTPMWADGLTFGLELRY